jgi:hypothetical protein
LSSVNPSVLSGYQGQKLGQHKKICQTNGWTCKTPFLLLHYNSAEWRKQDLRPNLNTSNKEKKRIPILGVEVDTDDTAIWIVWCHGQFFKISRGNERKDVLFKLYIA